MNFRQRFSAWLESLLPWYDPDREKAKQERFTQQIQMSRHVRMTADHIVASSRQDRRVEMRKSFRRAGSRLGER